MFGRNTDQEWELFGRIDPYYGVLTQDKYRQEYLTENARIEFFQSGEEYISTIVQNVRKYVDPGFEPKNSLDFGCGVGRLVIPLAKISEKVVGIDVSEYMIAEAKNNCEAISVNNVIFIKSDDQLVQLSQMRQKFDFIHSYIVFQHIPVHRGEIIFKNLLQYLKDDGVCVVHFMYAKSPQRYLISQIKKYIPLATHFNNLIKGGDFFAPALQMTSYDLNKLFYIIQKQNVINLYCEFQDDGGEFGVTIYFKKSSQGQK